MKRTDFRPNNNSSSMTDKDRMTIRNSYSLNPQYDSRKSFYGKATVTTENGRKTLKSYDTDVAYIENGKAVVTNTQSPTTVRHVKEFLKQNGFKADTKAQIEKDYSELAEKNPQDSKKLKEISREESTHAKELKKLELDRLENERQKTFTEQDKILDEYVKRNPNAEMGSKISKEIWMVEGNKEKI